MPVGVGVAIEKIIENMIAMAIGMPRLPQAMARKARKVAGTSSRPRRSGAECSSCTQKKSGSPTSGAGTICQNLPRRGPGRSGGAVTITPTPAAAAAATPSARWTPPEISSSPKRDRQPVRDVVAERHAQRGAASFGGGALRLHHSAAASPAAGVAGAFFAAQAGELARRRGGGCGFGRCFGIGRIGMQPVLRA